MIAMVKSVFFALFLFATGHKVGPQFFRGLGKSALPQVALTVVLCVTSLLTTVGAARLLGYDSGTAAGLMAGAFTESTVIGTVSDLVGTGFIVWFLSVLAPRLLRIDLKAESRKLATRRVWRRSIASQITVYPGRRVHRRRRAARRGAAVREPSRRRCARSRTNRRASSQFWDTPCPMPSGTSS